MIKPKKNIGLRPVLSPIPAPIGRKNRLVPDRNIERLAPSHCVKYLLYCQLGHHWVCDHQGSLRGREGTSHALRA